MLIRTLQTEYIMKSEEWQKAGIHSAYVEECSAVDKYRLLQEQIYRQAKRTWPFQFTTFVGTFSCRRLFSVDAQRVPHLSVFHYSTQFSPNWPSSRFFLTIDINIAAQGAAGPFLQKAPIFSRHSITCWKPNQSRSWWWKIIGGCLVVSIGTSPNTMSIKDFYITLMTQVFVCQNL